MSRQVTRQARWLAKQRAVWREFNRCLDCGRPQAVRVTAAGVKLIERCEYHARLNLEAVRRYQQRKERERRFAAARRKANR